MKPAILYAAKSTEDKRGSIPTQLEDARAMAEREGWGVVDQFQDEGFSAYSGNRGPGLERAKARAAEAAQEHGEAVLVAQHSDRFARGAGDSPEAAEHLVEVLTWANRHGVKLRTVQDDMFSDPRFGLLMAAMMGQRNTEDSRRKSELTKGGHSRRAARGTPNGGPRPYGYRRIDSEFEPVPHEAEIVRRIFAEFVAGKSLTAISRDLHREGIPTIKGGLWRQSTVRGIVKNPVYAGKIRHNGEVLPGQHEAILDPDTAARAAALLSATPTRKGRPTKGRHLFRGGLLRCQCGEAIVARTNGGYEMYYCNGRSKLGTEFCTMPHLRRDLIDSAVYSYFEHLGLDVEATRQALAASHDRKLSEAQALEADAERELHQAEANLARVRRYFQEGKIEPGDWAEQRPQLTAERDAARAEAKQRAEGRAKVEADHGLADAEAVVLRQLSEIRKAVAGEVQEAEGVEAVRAAMARLFDRFTLHQGTPQLGRKHRDDPPPEGPNVRPLLDVDDLTIEVWIRPQALEGWGDDLHPILRREPLEQARNKERNGSPLRHLFDRIPIGEGATA